MGKPGAGKSEAIKMTMSKITKTFNKEHDRKDYINLCAPTWATANKLGNGAITIHSMFNIRVDKIGDPMQENSIHCSEFIKKQWEIKWK